MDSLAFILFGAAVVAGQTYEFSKSAGDHDFLFFFRQIAQQAFSPPRDNELSVWQNLPFSWKLFGADVTGCFISDNGYIIFDREARSSADGKQAILAAGPDFDFPRVGYGGEDDLNLLFKPKK